jgi:hypothetical protein
MTSLSIDQQFAVIGVIPSRMISKADTGLFQALADALVSHPPKAATRP